MKPLSLHIENIGPFARLDLDLARLEGAVIAVRGANGAGKSTLLSSIYAALYRSFPDKSSGIYDFCTQDKAQVKLWFEAKGNLCCSVLKLNKRARLMEGELTVGGEVVTNGKLDSFDYEVRMLAGSGSLALASAYGTQNKSGNFLMLPRAERKAMLLDMLGGATLRDLHEAGKSLLKEMKDGRLVSEKTLEGWPSTDAELSEIAERMLVLADCKDRNSEKLAVFSDQLAESKLNMERVAAIAEPVYAELMKMRAEMDRADDLRRKIDSRKKECDEAEKVIATDELGARRRELEQLSKDREGLVEQAALAQSDYLSAFNKHDAYRAKVEKRSMLELRLKKAQEFPKAIRSIEELLEVARKTLEGFGDLASAAEAHLAYNASVERTAELLDALRRAESDTWKAQAGIKTLSAEIKQMEDSIAAAECSLISVKNTPCEGNVECPFVKAAIDKLQSQEDAQKLLDFSKDRLAKLNQSYEEALKDEEAKRTEWQDADMAQREAHRASVHAAQAESVKKSIREFESELARLKADAEAAEYVKSEYDAVMRELMEMCPEGNYREMLKSLSDASHAAKRKVDENEANQSSVKERIAFCENAESAVKGAKEAVAALEAELEETLNNLSDMPDVKLKYDGLMQDKNDYEADVKSYDAWIEQAKEEIVECDKELAVLEERKRKAEETSAKAAELRKDIERKNYEIEVANLVCEVLGPDWLQTKRLKLAVPAISALANELMYECFQGRFQLDFRFEEEKQSGKGVKTTFDMTAYNPEKGFSVPTSDLSGGERTVVEECVALAIALYNGSKEGGGWQTLFRDEVAGALDREAAANYIRALRKAVRMGGFDRAYFISHQPPLWDMADDSIYVGEGGAVIA